MTTILPGIYPTASPHFSQQTREKSSFPKQQAPIRMHFGQKTQNSRAKKLWFTPLIAALSLLAACGNGNSSSYDEGTQVTIGRCDNGNNGLTITTDKEKSEWVTNDHRGYNAIALDCNGEVAFDIDTFMNSNTAHRDDEPFRFKDGPAEELNFELDEETGLATFTLNDQDFELDLWETGEVTHTNQEES